MDPRFDGDLGKYGIGRMLGTPGGFGAAYEAMHSSGMPCVVKMFHGLQDADDMERLAVVLQRLKTVTGDRIVPVIDAGIDASAIGGPQPWLAMPRLRNAQSLDLRLLAGPPVGLGFVRSVLRDVAAGLAALHRAGMLHRDIKPSNILVDSTGRAWLIDFDLAKIVGATSLTPLHGRPGTLAWMSPEQLAGTVLPASDLWALGLVAHEMLTGRQPVLAFMSRDVTEIRRAIASAQLVASDVPAAWRPLVEALLHKLPAARPTDADTVARWIDDPSSVRLEAPTVAPPVAGTRWTVASRAEVDAVELARPGEAGVEAVDAAISSNFAAADHPRLRRGAQAARLSIAYEPLGVLQAPAAAGSGSLFAQLGAGLGDRDR